MKYIAKAIGVLSLASVMIVPVRAVELEVTHWWVSGGEAAAIKVLADAFEKNTNNTWKDAALARGGPQFISRIVGGNPMGATQLNHGREAEELIQNGLMLDLTEVAERENWKEIIRPKSLLKSCTFKGRIYCAPINIHSWQWMYLSHAAFKKAGVAVPKNWNEFVKSVPKLRAKGIVPLGVGDQDWQISGMASVFLMSFLGKEGYESVFRDLDEKTIRGPKVLAAFQALGNARKMSKGTNLIRWNDVTNGVIAGKFGAQIMGDWAKGEFQIAGQTPGKEYTCLPGLGLHPVLATGGDAFYFPVQDDPEIRKAQLELASLIVSKQVQVDFNAKKGSLPIRGDIDLSSVDDCTLKGLKLLASGQVTSSTTQWITPSTDIEMRKTYMQFWGDPNVTPEQLQKSFAKIILNDER